MSVDPDHEFAHVENELRRIKPAEPSARLKRRLESSVSFVPVTPQQPVDEEPANVVTPPTSTWRRPWLQSAAAALVGAAIVYAVWSFGPSGAGDPDGGTAGNPPSGPVDPGSEPQPIEPTFPRDAIRPDGFRVVGQENRLFHTQDDGIIYSEDKVPFRRVRYNTVDRRVFKDPETGAVFEMLVPREDVLIVPAETF